jgi:hypothetical protein
MENPIFIVGLPRSGSTLWLNILAQNHKICRINEIHYLTPIKRDFRYFLKKNVGNLKKDKNALKMVELIFSQKRILGIHESFWIYEIRNIKDTKFKNILQKRLLESDRSLGSIFKIIIEEISAVRGYSRCCVKFPVYVNYVDRLLDWYPQSKVIHITRDPRAIVISRINDPRIRRGITRKLRNLHHSNYFIKLTMICFVSAQYIWASKLHCKFNKLSNYALFRYEDLLSEPERVIKKLCSFTEIDFIPEMIAPEEGQPSSITRKKYKGFNKNSATNWMKVITPSEKKLITGLTRGSMKRFGYRDLSN